MIVGAGFILILLFIVPAILFYVFSKTRSPFKLGLLFGSIHFALVLAAVIFVYANLERDGESVMLFLIPFGLDLPVSLITLPLTAIARPLGMSGFMATNFWIPSFVFLVFGSFQYFFVGGLLGRFFDKVFKA